MVINSGVDVVKQSVKDSDAIFIIDSITVNIKCRPVHSQSVSESFHLNAAPQSPP